MKRRKVVMWLLIGALAIALVAIYEILPNSYERLPDPAKVKRMTAKLDYNEPRNLPKVPEFEVLAEDIPVILGSLEPKQFDFMAAAWVVQGELRLETVDGKEILVHLFWTSEKRGAFAVGPCGGQRYYRGGSDLAIDQVIRAAYARAKVAVRKGTQE
jgi:hypothetical protein